MANWFKLVGSTEDPVAEDWEHEGPEMFTEVRFPWNKGPKDIWAPGRLILYAVGSRVLVAVQTVDGPPQFNPRRGPPGSTTNRWPHTIRVRTHYYCSPLSSAPQLRDVSPEFADRYAKRFREGSHWKISDDEYEPLEAAIKKAGREYRPRATDTAQDAG